MVNTFTLTQSGFPKTVYWYPESNGHNVDFTRLSGGANFLSVDDLKEIINPDTTFNYCSSTTAEDFYGINTDLPMGYVYPTGVINYVRVHSRIKCDDISKDKPNVKIAITDDAGANQYYSQNIYATNEFANHSYAWSENPRTTLAWTWTDISTIETGILYGDVQTNTKNLAIVKTSLSAGQFRRISSDETYVYAAVELNGLKAYSKGSGLSLLDTQDDGGTYYDVWCDGTYIYTACGTSGLRVYTFDGITLVLKDTIDDGDTYWGVYGDGTYIYATCGDSGLRAYSFDGTSFTLEGSTPRLGDSSHEYREIMCDSGYVYAASQSGVYAYSFDGSSFAFLGSTAVEVFSMGKDKRNYIFIGDYDEDLHAYSFDGSSFTLIDTYSFGAGEPIWDIFGNDDYLYVTKEDDGLYVFLFDGTTFNLLATTDTSGDYRGCWCDEEYIYIAIKDSGVRVYEVLKNVSISQEYLEINYDTTETVSIPKPDVISSNSDMNTKMLNFWNGDREVYSVGRNSRTIVLSGIDWQDDACANIEIIRGMGLNGEDVVLSGLNMYIFNDTFKIRSFRWKKVSEKPIHFEWMLELEYKT